MKLGGMDMIVFNKKKLGQLVIILDNGKILNMPTKLNIDH